VKGLGGRLLAPLLGQIFYRLKVHSQKKKNSHTNRLLKNVGIKSYKKFKIKIKIFKTYKGC
jgi:hypothetical protein